MAALYFASCMLVSQASTSAEVAESVELKDAEETVEHTDAPSSSSALFEPMNVEMDATRRRGGALRAHCESRPENLGKSCEGLRGEVP
jgi:hypothetical protein